MIPEAAVEAGMSALLAHYGYSSDEAAADGADIAEEREYGAKLVSTLLEAAAPHMLTEAKAAAWDEGVADMHEEAYRGITAKNPYRK